MNYLIFLLIFIVLNFILFTLNKFIAKNMNLYDFPDFKRKIHIEKIPVTGGIFIYVNIIIFLIFTNIYDNFLYNSLFEDRRELFSFIFLISSLFLIGLYDDKYNLKPIPKLSLSILAIFISILLNKNLLLQNLSFDTLNFEIDLSNLSIVFSIFCILIFLNALNMFDGIDSQVSAYSIFFLLYLTVKSGFFILIFLFPVFCFNIFYNFKKKLFLGDSGTNIISALIAFLVIKLYNATDNFTSDEIFLLMMIPGLDLIRLFIIRIVKGKNPFLADSNHIHHLYLKKFSLNTTFLIIQFQIIFPIILFYIFNVNLLFLILLSSSIYLLIVLYFTYLKKI